jgi:hypothetical protein
VITPAHTTKRLLAGGLALAVAGLVGCSQGPATPPARPIAPAPPATATGADAVPLRVRVLRGARKGPARLDPQLVDLKKQLGKLAYQTWDQVKVTELSMADRKTQYVELPGGHHVGLTLQDVRGEIVTLEVALTQRNTMSRLTVAKGQRIVHQVTGEKDGVAYYVTLMAWPK